MDGWMDGGQIRIALESSSVVSSKDVMSISVSQSSDLERGNNAFKNKVPSPNCMTDSLYTAVANKYYDFSL